MAPTQKPTKPRYATASNPTIQAVLAEMYRFASEEEARRQLDVLKRHFLHSRQQIRNDGHPSVHLWIKGYALEAEDAARGVIGHFAIISYRQVEGKYTLYATKLPAEPKLHPQRAQVKRDNPNWGHSVLRAVRKGKAYATLEQAEAELALLHAQFPRVSIPNPGKLYIMIYCADRPAKQRMVKHTLEIRALPKGSYCIECKENIQKPVPKRPSAHAGVASPPPTGYFTAKVALGRARRPRKTLPKNNT